MSIQVNSEGVSASRVFLPADQAHPNLLQFFIAQFPHIQASEWEQRFDQSLILDIEGQPLSASDPYQPNTHLMYFRRLAREPEIPFEEQILFQDEHILVADKPHFLPVTPSGLYLHQTLLNRLKKKIGIQTLSPIHRIDRDTYRRTDIGHTCVLDRKVCDTAILCNIQIEPFVGKQDV